MENKQSYSQIKGHSTEDGIVNERLFERAAKEAFKYNVEKPSLSRGVGSGHQPTTMFHKLPLFYLQVSFFQATMRPNNRQK